MKSHWPVLAAILLICAAAFGGAYWRQARAARLLAPPASPAKPASAATPAAGTADSATAAAEAASSAGKPAASPAPASETTRNTAIMAPGALPPAAPANPPAGGLRLAPESVLQELRKVIQDGGDTSQTTPNGGYFFEIAGARLEVQPMPNWSITLYNKNMKNPGEETGDFKKYLNIIAMRMSIDISKTPTELNGKTYLRTPSKLGTVTLIRDAANGNSCTIKPLGGAAPVPPAAQPIQKPAPKNGDENF
jgi:hypothetical protein